MQTAQPPWPPRPGAAQAVALEVLLHGPLSRSEIARRLDLSQGSLTRLSAPLIEDGLLIELTQQPNGHVDRRSRPLDVDARSHHFIGVKLSGTHALGVATDLRANVVASDEVRLASLDPAAVAGQIADLADRLAEHVPAVTAVGIGLGALVADAAVVRSAPFLGWTDVPLGPMLTERTGLATVVENDLVAFTEAEHWFGAGRGLDRFAVLTVGAGVGYGAVTHGRILVGQDSGNGLVGHWPLDPTGPLCPAGHRGCADSTLSSPAVTRTISAALGRNLDYDTCLDLAEAGDPAARRVVDDAGRGLGRLIAAVANLVVPEKVILGGEGIRLAHVAADAVAEGLHRDRHPLASAVHIEIINGDTTEWCRGAAVIAIQTYVLGTL